MFKKAILGTVILLAFGIAGFFLLLKVIDFNEYKPRILKAVKESTGYEIVIRGDITPSLSPVGINVFDIEVINPSCQPEKPFAKIGSLEIALEPSALIKKEVRIHYIAIDNAEINIEKNKEGKFNYELVPQVASKGADKKPKDTNATSTKKAKNETTLFWDVTKVFISNSDINYTEPHNNLKLFFDNIDMDMRDIVYDKNRTKLQGLFFLGNAHIDAINYNDYSLNDISASVEMRDGRIVSESLRYLLFDSLVQGSGKFDFSGKQPKVVLKGKASALKLQNLAKELWKKENLEGFANGDFKLIFFLGDALTFKSTLQGFIQLYGEDVTLKGYDFDKLAAVFDPAQKASKGLNLSSLAFGALSVLNGGNTLFKQINTKVEMGYSELRFSDVAYSTPLHRAALKGSFQLIEDSLKDVSIALLDEKGCASVEQKLSGSLTHPSLKLDSQALNTLSHVVFSFSTKKKKEAQPTASTQNADEDACNVFYEGVVKHPDPMAVMHPNPNGE